MTHSPTDEEVCSLNTLRFVKTRFPTGLITAARKPTRSFSIADPLIVNRRQFANSNVLGRLAPFQLAVGLGCMPSCGKEGFFKAHPFWVLSSALCTDGWLAL